jgi:hypothetical protein
VFACLGVALALHGHHAIRARLLNAASAGTSVFMNVIAAAPGWRDAAVWVMPPAAYALASDTLIGVVRVRVTAAHRGTAGGPMADDANMLSVAGGLVLWLLRLCLAPGSTLAGFRAWVLVECPVAPGRRAPAQAQLPPVDPVLVLAAEPPSRRGSPSRDGTKTARFLALVAEQYGPLAMIPSRWCRGSPPRSRRPRPPASPRPAARTQLGRRRLIPVESAMTDDLLTAALDQLAAHREQISALDAREARHFASLSEQLTQLAAMIAAVGHVLHDDTAALARIEAIEHKVADLAEAADNAGHRPGPAPAWWSLAGAERREAAAPLRAWVTQVYQPGYGHLAATLGPCWEAHDLCLYGLDILVQLWAVLYSPPTRSTGLLSAQAEYQARILPAIAAQLTAETTGCGHDQARRPAPGYPRSMP